MKKSAISLAAVLFLAVIGYAAQTAQNGQTFTGEIMDSACAAQGSHAAMLTSHGMAGKQDDPAAKKSCTEECVKAGSKLVLYQASTKTTYQLDDQKKAAELAGQTVKVNGSLDAKTNTIHVQNIAKAS